MRLFTDDAKSKIAPIITAVIAVCITSPVSAQLLRNTPAIGTLSTGGGSLSSSEVQDVVTGAGTRGPYYLTWNGIPAQKETVIVDGRRMVRGIDYLMDWSKGALSFTNPLRTGNVATVQYPIDPQKSKRNASGYALPVSLSLIDSGDSQLQLTSLFRQDNNQDSTAILGLEGKTQIGSQTSISTSLLTSLGSGEHDTNALEQSAARINAASQLGSFKITGGMQLAGTNFAGSKDYKMNSGQNVQDFGIAYNPSGSRFTWSSAYNRVDSGREDSASSLTTVNHNLGYNIAPSTKFLFARRETEKQAATGRTFASNLYQLESAIGAKTNAVFTWTDTVEQLPGNWEDRITTQRLAVNSNLLARTAVSASFVNEASTQSGESQTVNVGIVSKPFQYVEFQANLGGYQRSANGQDNNSTFRIAAVPNNKWKVSTGMSERQKFGVGERSHDVRLDAKPFDFISVSSGYGYTYAGLNGTVTRDISANAKPFDFLAMDGSYKNRDYGMNELDTTTFNVQLTPFPFLGITASLLDNPEDRKGNVQMYDSRSLGLKATFGILFANLDYAFRDEYTIDREWVDKSVGVGLNLAKSTQLTGGYRISETQTAALLEERRLTLGIKRDLGSDFNLALSGTRRDILDSGTFERTDYEAEVRGTIRF